MSYISFEVEGLTVEQPSIELEYNPSMANLRDGVTKIIPTSGINKAVTNVMVVPFENGTFDLVLVHSLKDEGEVVLEAEIVAKWHFNSVTRMQSFVDMLAKSVNNAQLIDKSKLKADPDEFYKTLMDVTRKVDEKED